MSETSRVLQRSAQSQVSWPGPVSAGDPVPAICSFPASVRASSWRGLCCRYVRHPVIVRHQTALSAQSAHTTMKRTNVEQIFRYEGLNHGNMCFLFVADRYRLLYNFCHHDWRSVGHSLETSGGAVWVFARPDWCPEPGHRCRPGVIRLSLPSSPGVIGLSPQSGRLHLGLAGEYPLEILDKHHSAGRAKIFCSFRIKWSQIEKYLI